MKKFLSVILFLIMIFSTVMSADRREEYFNVETREDNLLYKKDEDKPYTGIVIITEEDKILKEQVYKDGKINFEKGYYENGNIKWESTGYKDGKLHGVSRVYYKNGQLQMESNYKNGQKDGIEKGYQENGKIVGELNYKKGCLDGISKFYDKNGNLEHEQNYRKSVV